MDRQYVNQCFEKRESRQSHGGTGAGQRRMSHGCCACVCACACACACRCSVDCIKRRHGPAASMTASARVGRLFCSAFWLLFFFLLLSFRLLGPLCAAVLCRRRLPPIASLSVRLSRLARYRLQGDGVIPGASSSRQSAGPTSKTQLRQLRLPPPSSENGHLQKSWPVVCHRPQSSPRKRTPRNTMAPPKQRKIAIVGSRAVGTSWRARLARPSHASTAAARKQHTDATLRRQVEYDGAVRRRALCRQLLSHD